ncbi:prostaglandin-E(2) 9-reductase-like [Cylas formicarius]|uniref:prostaglandin-E(2) 9-reductase-like n=1 Tax=Cylas formicarius TaxID=197179 RepID=UPI002958C877|nr:prostaglandin-E(2) 9-reductase-like [Cylas formicarius]
MGRPIHQMDVRSAFLYGDIEEQKTQERRCFHNYEIAISRQLSRRKFLKESLAAPQMNYVDLYLVHSPIRMRGRFGGVDGLSMHHVGVWREMEKQVKAGRAKTIGVSNFNQRQVERLLKEAEIKPVCNQIELNVPQTQLMEFLQANGIVVVSFHSLGSSRPIERRDKIGLPQTAARSSGISSPCTRRLKWLYLCNMPNKKYINV